MILFFVLAVLVLPSPSVGQQPSSPDKQDATAVERARYVGLMYRELPIGLKKDDESAIIEKSEDYRLDVIVRGKMRMLWFSRVIDRDVSEKQNSKVKDVVVLPTLTTRQEIRLACYVGKRPPANDWDYDIAAVVHVFYKGDAALYRPLKAWRANRKTERLEAI